MDMKEADHIYLVYKLLKFRHSKIFYFIADKTMLVIKLLSYYVQCVVV